MTNNEDRPFYPDFGTVSASPLQRPPFCLTHEWQPETIAPVPGNAAMRTHWRCMTCAFAIRIDDICPPFEFEKRAFQTLTVPPADHDAILSEVNASAAQRVREGVY